MVLYGASGHAKVVIDILEANNVPIDYIVDDDNSISELLGYNVKHNCKLFDEVLVAIGSCQQRKAVVENIIANKYTIAIHPSAIISPRARIEDGTVIKQGTIVQSCASIGKHCVVNTGASVGHDVKLADYVHIAPQAVVTGNVEVGECSWIGAGAVMVKDVADGDTVVGSPARCIIRKN